MLSSIFLALLAARVAWAAFGEDGPIQTYAPCQKLAKEINAEKGGELPDAPFGVGFIKIQKEWPESDPEPLQIPPTHWACIAVCRNDPKCGLVVMDSKFTDAGGWGCTTWENWDEYRSAEAHQNGTIQGEDYQMEYYQKFCRSPEVQALIEERGCEEGLFTGTMNTNLWKHVVAVHNDTKSLDDCLKKCLEDESCKSFQMLYTSTPATECILNGLHSYEKADDMERIDWPRYGGIREFVDVFCDAVEHTAAPALVRAARLQAARKARILAARRKAILAKRRAKIAAIMRQH